jgi:pilus assembly protein CpaB
MRHFGASPVRGGTDRTKLLLVLVLVLLFVFLMVAYVMLGSDEGGGDANRVPEVVAQPTPGIRKVEVLIPIQAIPAQTKLEPHMFRVEERPAVSVDERMVKSFEEIVNHWAKTLIIANQPLTTDHIQDTRPVSQIDGSIPAGFRAVTIRTDSTTAVEGWVRPGSKVDVLWTYTHNGEPILTTIVQNAKILSAARNINPDNPNAPVPSTVTMLVTAEDAQKIELAKTTGKISLSLRGSKDVRASAVGEGNITLNDLVSGGGKMADRKPRDEFGTVSIGGRQFRVGPRGLEPLED